MFTFEYNKYGTQYEILFCGHGYGKLLHNADCYGDQVWKYMLASDNEYTCDLTAGALMEIVYKLNELNVAK